MSVHPQDSGGESDVDENDEVIAGEGMMEGGKVAQPEVQSFGTVPGYNNVRLDAALLPPPPSDAPKAKPSDAPEFTAAPVITEESARQALLEYADSKCCWGTGAAKKLQFKELQSSTSYHYILETSSEGRKTSWDHEPYHGQFVDGPQNGQAPGAWDIEAKPKELYKDETRYIEVPHTAVVKDCHNCGARGFLICSSCSGRGRKRCGACRGRGRRRVRRKGKTTSQTCMSCWGTGKRTCGRCSGSGRITCPVCQGHRQLKWFIKLTVEWKNNYADHIVEKTALPDELIAGGAGTLGFSDEQIQVLPIARFPEPEINDASHRLVNSHRFPNLKVLMQRHVIRIVPVTQCFYKYSDKEQSYFVYGLDCKVHAPEYPDQCCWGCTIL